MTAPGPDRMLVTEADLTAALAGKAGSTHAHAQSEVTGLTAALTAKANTTHTHATAQVTGLDAALTGKANTTHTHATAQVTGLDNILNGKAASNHTHTEFTEATGDVGPNTKGKLVRIHPSWGKIFNYIDPNDVVDPKEFVSKNWVDAQTNSREPLSWSGTQAQYDALATKDPNRTYFVSG